MGTGVKGVLPRLFLVQGSWNYDRLLGLGLGWAVRFALPDANARASHALARASGHFNAHPYLAGLAAGALVRMEQDGTQPEEVVRLREALRAPLGAVGDELFWAGVLPAAAGLGLASATLGLPGLGAGVLLVAHNAVHLPVRAWGVRRGWALGHEVARALGVGWLRRARQFAGNLAPFSIGLALAPVLIWLLGDVAGLRLGAVAVAAAALVAHRIAPGLGAVRIGLLAALAALLGGAL